ncbi:MAG: hypothetical protein JXO72_12330 [Vicinamibacteria bacterium]|nr:hypothetical protein [Vicinamibacteria bacterium]
MKETLRRIISGRPLLFTLFALTLPLVTPKIRGADEIEYFAHLRSFVFDGDLDFENEYRRFHARDPRGLAGFKATFLDRREPTNRPLNFAPIGTALLWAPFYLTTHAGVMLARAFGSTIAADGLSRPYIAAVCYASALYGFLGLLCIHASLRRFARAEEPEASWSVAALWLATPVLYYMTIAPGFSHAGSLFCVALLLHLWLDTRVRRDASLGRYAILGAIGGLTGMVREQDLFFLVVPGLDIVWQALRERRLGRGSCRALTMLLAAVIAFTPQLFAYHAINGSFWPSKHVARKMSFHCPHFFEVLFDPAHGLFFWSPILLVAAVALLARMTRFREKVVVLLAIGVLMQVWLNGSVESWSQAGAFGARRFVGSTAVFAWGLAHAWIAISRRFGRGVMLATSLVFVWWNLSLMVQFGLRIMDRQRLDWPRVAINQFIEVPPRIARTTFLFFTDRERIVREAR